MVSNIQAKRIVVFSLQKVSKTIEGTLQIT